jgi:hypothetical protein
MKDLDLSLDLGMLCRCCDYQSYKLPPVEGLTDSQRKVIEEICKECIENMKLSAVNS